MRHPPAPLRLAGSLTLASAAAFAALTVAVGLGWTLPLDVMVLDWLAARRDCAVIIRATLLSFVGAGEVSLVLTGLCAIGCLLRRRPLAAASLSLLYLSLPIELAMKLWLPQPLPGAVYPLSELCEWYRPALSLTTPHSYPSGYAIRTSYFAALAVALVWASGRLGPGRHTVAGWTWVVAGGIGVLLCVLLGSRLVLSWHWLSDLVGGALLGLTLAAATWWLLSTLAAGRADPDAAAGA